MKKKVSIKTITEVESSGLFLISSFSNVNDDGSTTPYIHKSQVLEKPMTIDSTLGKEGELLISYSGKKSGEINRDGELIINTDDSDKYIKDKENLTYDEG